jgi:hypothetical protein
MEEPAGSLAISPAQTISGDTQLKLTLAPGRAWVQTLLDF